MPFPQWLAKMNRRFTNRILIRLATRPPFAALNHTGRSSGHDYRIPLNAFPTPTGFVLPATYGTGADWVLNLLAAGEAKLEYAGQTLPLTAPRLVDLVDARPYLPLWVRWFLPIVRVRDFVLCDTDLGRTA
jgi:deazaflavin-dependent oxidoreductase (nitroreductase family)